MSLKKFNKESQIRGKILKWYKCNGRQLPWRKSKSLPNPYHIFVSEYMLQQTTVKAVIPKFKLFIKKWPTLVKLSRIKESNILEFWSGLGYYSRARNLLKSSKIIHSKYNNIVPRNYSELISLPGVGDYTAKAIQGIAYNLPVLPIDANIERFLIRIYGLIRPIKLLKLKSKEVGVKLVSSNNSTNFIQALMDYGSIICLPTKPKCDLCIINKYCIAFNKNLIQDILKNKIPNKKKLKKFTRAYVIINEFNEVLVRRRKEVGMLQLMIEIPTDEWVLKKNTLKIDNEIKSFSLKFFKIKQNLLYSFSHFDLNIEILYSKVKKK